MKFREAFPDVDIDRFHIETEERVRKFHSALYELVVDKYGEFLARKLLRMPPRTKMDMKKRANALVLYKFFKSGLKLTEFTKREDADNPENLARNMQNWYKDKKVKDWIESFYVEELLY